MIHAIFDMSSVMWTCLLAGSDPEYYNVSTGNDKEVKVNTARYGYENSVNHINKSLSDWNFRPNHMVMVFEGKDSKNRRCMIDPLYKSGDSRIPEQYIEFNMLKEQLWEAYGAVGAMSASQPFCEGDDVIAFMAENAEEDLHIFSGDKDLLALQGKNTHGAMIHVHIRNVEPNINPYGDFPFKLITLYKTLVGDPSDKVKGCPGFGPAAFLAVNARYDDDGCFELLKLIAQGDRDEVAQFADSNDCKHLRKIVENWHEVAKSYELVKLRPEWVNTNKHVIEWKGGTPAEIKDERLKPWKDQVVLVHAGNYDQMCRYIEKKLEFTDEVGFDIETSTPDESDDWLAAKGKPDAVDMFGSVLTGFSFTFGSNDNLCVYVPVDHKETDTVKNITMSQARKMIELFAGKRDIVVQNNYFELTVLNNAQDEDGTYWKDHWKDNGYYGFLPRTLDTKLEGSYVNENMKLGLKGRSEKYLNYKQVEYTEVTTIDGVQYKMNELEAEHVLSYGADDAICAMRLHRLYRFIMQLEHTWKPYLEVEIDSSYLNAKAFNDGVPYSLARQKELEAEDDATHEQAWGDLKAYLTAKQWPGTVLPQYGADITAAQIKEAYGIITSAQIKEAYGIITGLSDPDEEEGENDEDDAATYHAAPKEAKPKDPILSSHVRTPAKFPALIEDVHPEMAEALYACLQGAPSALNQLVKSNFKGEPIFKISNKMLCKLLYETMGLPIRVRNKPTAKMKAEGIRQGNPKGDVVAVGFGLIDADEDQKKILRAIQLLKMVATRRSLYYSKYPYSIHWKDGLLHSSHNQCGTNTRRASSSDENLQQLPKHAKVEGQDPKFRETITTHATDAVVVSFDFDAQELRLITNESHDPLMEECYVSATPKKMHGITGANILAKKKPDIEMSYEIFMAAREDKENPLYALAKEYYHKGKTVNFSTEYLVRAAKLAATMLVTEEDAQEFIDVKEETFHVASAWKEKVIEEAKKIGYVTTLMGVRRHLADLFNSDDWAISSKADRQAVNFIIQSSSGEQTKLAKSRVWKSNILSKYDMRFYFDVHDELVFSIKIKDLYETLPAIYKMVTENYGGMHVPIISGVSFGPNFGNQFELNSEDMSKEVIDRALKKMYEWKEKHEVKSQELEVA